MEITIKIFTWLIAIISFAWVSKRFMDNKQHYIVAMYFTYCVIQGYALAADVMPSKNSLSPEAFIIGLAGAICVCAWLSKLDSTPKTYGTLIFSMLASGLGWKVASTYFVYKCTCSSVEELKYIMPLIIGAVLPFAVPIILTVANNKWGKVEGGKDNV